MLLNIVPRLFSTLHELDHIPGELLVGEDVGLDLPWERARDKRPTARGLLGQPMVIDHGGGHGYGIPLRRQITLLLLLQDQPLPLVVAPIGRVPRTAIALSAETFGLELVSGIRYERVAQQGRVIAPAAPLLGKGKQALVALNLRCKFLDHKLQLLDQPVPTLELLDKPLPALLQVCDLRLRRAQRN